MKKYLLLICPVAALVAELLPWGAVLVFAPSPGERVRETYSYFSMMPFGYANCAPLLTGLLTVALIVFALVCALRNSNNMMKPVCVISCVALVASFLPLVFGLDYFTAVGGVISLMFAAEILLCQYFKKKSA